jgi:hypothetical protein
VSGDDGMVRGRPGVTFRVTYPDTAGVGYNATQLAFERGASFDLHDDDARGVLQAWAEAADENIWEHRDVVLDVADSHGVLVIVSADDENYLTTEVGVWPGHEVADLDLGITRWVYGLDEAPQLLLKSLVWTW